MTVYVMLDAFPSCLYYKMMFVIYICTKIGWNVLNLKTETWDISTQHLTDFNVDLFFFFHSTGLTLIVLKINV